MYQRKDAEANRNRLYSEGTPFIETFGNYTECEEQVRAMIDLGRESAKHTSRNGHLETKLSANEHLLDAALMLTGLSREKIKGFLQILALDNGFGKHTDRVKEYIKYNHWETYGDKTKSKDNARKYGLAKFILNARYEFPELKQYAWCDYKRIIDIQSSAYTTIQALVHQKMMGSMSAKNGNRKQSILQSLLMSVGVPTETKRIQGSFSTYDLSNDRFAAEVSYPNATGSGQSQKTSRMASEAEEIRRQKGKDFHLMYIGGGTGLLPRKNDVRKLTTTMDYCFGPTMEQAIDFVHCVKNEIYGDSITKEQIVHDLKSITEYYGI